jgi:hypothetical protein
VLVTEQDGTLRGIVSERDLFPCSAWDCQISLFRQADGVDALIALNGIYAN